MSKSSQARNQQNWAAAACFLLALLFNPEDGGNMFPRNVKLSPNYMVLQPRRPYS
jgi:hypothetical protein